MKRKYPVKKQTISTNSELTSDPMLITNDFANFYTKIAPKLKKLLLPLNNVIWQKEAELIFFLQNI